MPQPWIFFDAAGTLFTVRGSVGNQYALAARRFNAACDPKALDAAFHRCFAAAPPLAFAPANMTKPRLRPRAKENWLHDWEFQWWRDLVRQVCQQAHVSVPFEKYFEYLFGIFATARCWDLYPETTATLKILKATGYSLAIVSNFDSRLYLLTKDLGLRPFISEVLHSSALGAAKPDEKIFLEACHRVGARPQSSWHVGDSLIEDFEAARRAGLNAILLDRNGEHSDISGPKVNRLSQILALLPRLIQNL